MAKPDKDIVYRRQLEAVAGGTPSTIGSVVGAVLAGAAVALILGSQDLLAWADNLPIGNFSDHMLAIAQAWQDLMAGFGVTGYAETLHKLLTAWQALRWHSG